MGGVVLGGMGVCVRVNPSYRGSVTTVGIYHCGTIVTAEDRHGLCPRDDGYSTGIIFNTRVTGGGSVWEGAVIVCHEARVLFLIPASLRGKGDGREGVMTRQKKSRQKPTLESL